MVYLETLFLWRIRVCGVFVFGLSVHALRLVLYCLFPVVGCRLPCYDAWCMPRSALVAFLAFRCLSTHLCLYYFSFFVTVYLVLKAPPSCRWFSVLLLCIPARCLCSFCLYPCSPSRLLLFIYHMCLPLPVVLTPLLYVALCMPRTALVVFMAFCVCFTHLCPRLYLSVLLLYVCLTACLVCIYSFRACGFPVGTLPTTVCVVPGL